MVASKKVLGKIFTYLGLLVTGIGSLGIIGPHLELQRSGRLMAQVVSNDIAYRQPGAFGYRLQLMWTSVIGEQRSTITTIVRAASEEEAHRKYKGNHLIAGQTYEFYTDPERPDRIQPFKGYNWATFGMFGMLIVAGIIVFFTGMSIIRRERAAARTSSE